MRILSKVFKAFILAYQLFIFMFIKKSMHSISVKPVFSNGRNKIFYQYWRGKLFTHKSPLSFDDIYQYLNLKTSKVFHIFIKIRPDSGIDIKDEWEVGRLNLLIGYAINNSKFSPDDVIDILKVEQLKNIGFGVQWKCAMDVALRAVNLTLINNFYDGRLSDNKKYNRFVIDSLDYIVLNLEKYGDWRGNHYLTNLVGILIITAHIDSKKCNKMFDFALVELLIELDRQFLPDGSNFEGSTAYHHFGLELLSVVHTVLKKVDYNSRREHYSNPFLLTNLGIKKCAYDEMVFSNVLSKLESKISRGLYFSIASLDNKGRLIQIGDNDSGKVFRTCYTKDHNPEFYADIVYQISESLNTGKFPCCVESEGFYTDYVESLRRKKHFNPKYFQDSEFEVAFSNAENIAKRTYKFHIKDNNFPTSLEYFDDFGLVIARSLNSVFTFRCGPIGQFGKGGHDHYDQLSITLNDCGKRVIADPGVGCYTKDTSVRNRYRSSKSHFGLMSKGEVDDYSNLFSICATPSKLIAIQDKKIVGKQVVNNVQKYRCIEFEQNQLIIRDVVVNGEILDEYDKLPYSPGYGIIENE